MKRTFGKILSFALVLAMLLAMVPAVLAATTESLYLAPGETKTLSCENAKYWRSSNDSVVRVAGGSDGSATITAVASSSSYYGNSATISAYAYEKESDYNAANPSDRKEALKTWNVTVTNWAITLSTTTSGGYNSGYGYDKELGKWFAWATFEMEDSEVEWLRNLLSADTVIMRFEGTDYSKFDYTWTVQDRQAITDIIDLYHLLKAATPEVREKALRN